MIYNLKVEAINNKRTALQELEDARLALEHTINAVHRTADVDPATLAMIYHITAKIIADCQQLELSV